MWMRMNSQKGRSRPKGRGKIYIYDHSLKAKINLSNQKLEDVYFDHNQEVVGIQQLSGFVYTMTAEAFAQLLELPLNVKVTHVDHDKEAAMTTIYVRADNVIEGLIFHVTEGGEIPGIYEYEFEIIKEKLLKKEINNEC